MKIGTFFALFVLAVALGAAGPSMASDLDSFSRFRLLTSTGERVEGRNARLGADSLMAFDLDGKSFALSRDRIRVLDVSKGTNAGRGAAIGAGMGLLIGLLAAINVGMDDRYQLDGSAAVSVTAGLTVVGGLVGLAVGSSSPRWQSLPVRVAGVTPEGRAYAVSVSLRF